MVRRGSNSSTLSYSSTISGVSLGQTSSASSVDTQRKLPPPLEQAKLPPLPPTRRELEEKAKANKEAKIPLISLRSAPNVLQDPPVVERDLAQKMPSKPNGPPRLPPRLPPRAASSNNLKEDMRQPSKNNLQEDIPPPQPPRPLPLSAAVRPNILSMGFNNKKGRTNLPPIPVSTHLQPTPSPGLTPMLSAARSTGHVIYELTARNFDGVIMSGTPAFVDFYAPYCKYCKELDPIWKELGDSFAFSKKIIIAKVDVHEHKAFMQRFDIQGYPTILYFDGNNETPEKYPYMRELEPLTEFLEEKTGISVADGASEAVPPPINMTSKPSFAQVKAIQSQPDSSPPIATGCLICRDFSRPDQVASQYPRQSLPRNGDMTAYLADVLCSEFLSLTDKARAIFTWLHHNIAYDTVAFFGKNVKHVDPKDTITTGLAVCGGYAGLYVAIALKAGLECVMVTGHGKGYGYSPLKPGDPIPTCNPAGHAWNAVRIDGGEWKLIDACWGAGNVGNQVYNKKFTPSYFTMSNDDFGIKHFPSDDAYFFRSDGRAQTWEAYMIGPVGSEPLQLYGAVEDHGLSGTSFSPPHKHISVRSKPNEIIRFQFSKACEHWDHEKNGNGKPYCLILKVNGVDGRKEDYIAFEYNDFWYWADVPAKELGAPGQGISVFAVTSVNGKDARGMSRREYLGKKGKCGMGFGGVCAWNLVQ